MILPKAMFGLFTPSSSDLNTKGLQTIVFNSHPALTLRSADDGDGCVTSVARGNCMANISPDTPLRLSEAVKAAFPAGGMTVSGLRREIARGRLEAELIANKHFVTLAGIARMRELCTVSRVRQPDENVAPKRVRRSVPGPTDQERLDTKLRLRREARAAGKKILPTIG